MFKRFWIFLTIAAVMAPFFCTAVAYAGPDIGNEPGGLLERIRIWAGYGAADQFTLSEMVGRLIKVVISLMGTIFLALTVYAGFLWMTAGGNSARLEKAKDVLKNSTIGLIIVLAAYSITVFILFAILSSTGAPTAQSGTTVPAGAGAFIKNNWYRLFF